MTPAEKKLFFLVDKIMLVIERHAYVGDGEDRDAILTNLYSILEGKLK